MEKKLFSQILKEELENYDNELIPVIPNRFVYHVTNSNWRENIFKNGLVPKVGDSRFGIWENDEKVIFCTNATEVEHLFNNSYDDDVWEINTDNLLNKWYFDNNYSHQEKNFHILTFERIPVTSLKLVYKGSNRNEWDLSNDDIERKNNIFKKYNLKETVSIDQLKDKTGNYLNQNVGKPHTPVNPVVEFNNQLRGLIATAKNEIQNLDYRDIDFLYIGLDDLKSETYEIVLPDEIETTVKTIINKFQEAEKHEAAQSWYFQIDSEGEFRFNRIHFNNGLPFELRGTGFGYKIYKAFITIKGFASSATNSTDDARRLWIKLVQESDFECIISDKVLLILNKKLHNKLNLTKQFIEFYMIHLNSSNTVISDSLYKEIKPYIPLVLGGSSQEEYDIQKYPTPNENLKPGDTVFVFDVHSNIITNNEQLAKSLGATNWKKGLNNLQEYDAVKVLNIVFNQGENVALVYSPKTKMEYLMNMEGLETQNEKDVMMNQN